MKIEITFDREAFTEFLSNAEGIETVKTLASSLSKFLANAPISEIGIKEEPSKLLFLDIEHTSVKLKEGKSMIGPQRIFIAEEAGQLAERLGHQVAIQLEEKTMICNP